MNKVLVLSVLIFGLFLAACSSSKTPAASSQNPEATGVSAAVEPTAVEPTAPAPAPQPASQDLLRSDAQGAVVIDVTPTNLGQDTDTLTFEVSMNTHSVDLSMNLALLATLSADNGQSVQAVSWDAPSGGHHVSGTLSFPTSLDGKLLLEGATMLTLSIKDVDAPERIFRWELSNKE